METRSDSESNVTIHRPSPLNSDQLNYLIWRYLQESGYGEAAVKLQRDWSRDPQSLPFARHIKGRALVSLVQHGLRYYHLSRTIDQHGQASIPLQPSMFFFGPETARAFPSPNREASDETGTGDQAPSPKASASGARKHARESGPNGAADHAVQPAPKRSRKTAPANGIERKAEPILQQSAKVTHDETAMEIDHMNGYSHHQHADSNSSDQPPTVLPAENSPPPAEVEVEGETDVGNDRLGAGLDRDQDEDMDGDIGAFEPQDQERITEPAAPVYTLTNGHSVGVQISPAKVADLKPETKILAVADDLHVTQAFWRPKDPTVLAASGEYFCGMWRVSNQSLRSDAQSPPYHSLVDRGENTIVSAVSWEPGGSMLAIATYSNLSGQLRIYDGQDAVLVESLPAAQKMITSLRWQSLGSRLVGFAYDTKDSSLVLWDLLGAQQTSGPSSITVPEAIFDVDWASHGNVSIVCAVGEGVVYQCRALSDLVLEHKWTSDPADQNIWNFVRCSWWSDDHAVAIAASAESASLWIPTKDVLLRDVHAAAITCLELRPGQMIHPDKDSVHEFATSSIDTTIKMWRFDEQANSVNCVLKLSIGHSSPILALAYSPDGFYTAGASYDQVQIWNAEKGNVAVARWDSTGTIWQGVTLKPDDSMTNGDTRSEDDEKQELDADHSLSWDADGKKLAFGLGNQVALINFQH